MAHRSRTRIRRFGVCAAALGGSVALLLPPAAGAPMMTFVDGDTRTVIVDEVASTQLLGYSCGDPTPMADPACNNFPLRFEVTDDFNTIYIGLTTDAVRAPDLDLYLYDAEGNELGSSAQVGSAERAVIRLDRPLTTDAVLVVQPYMATQGTAFTLDLRVKTSKAVPDPITTR